MSTEFIILAGLIVIVGIILYVRGHPGLLRAQLSQTESRVQDMINSRKPSTPAPAPAVVSFPPPPTVDHVGVINAAMQGAASVVSSLPAGMSTIGGIPIGVGNGSPAAPAAPADTGPPEVRSDQNGQNLWTESFWRCNLEAGQSASRDFEVPAGYSGVIEYFADNAAMQGDFAVTLDGQSLVGAGQEITSLCPAGKHTLAAKCVDPLSVGRTWATSALSIRHTP